MMPEVLAGTNPYAGRTLIILNPKAGQDDPARLRRMIGGAFAARCAPFDLVETRGAGHAIELARTGARLGYRAVCVVGGDGTLAEAATGVAGTDVPLGLIPRGTANQVAQNLNIPTEFEAAVETVVNGTPMPLDLGRIGARDQGERAAVMAAATRPMKERWGFGAYIFAAVKEALTAAPADFRIVADGEEIRVRAVTVMLANMGELYAHFLPFSFPLGPRPTHSWQDGLFDVVIVAPRNPTEFPAILWRAATRRFSGDDRLIHFQAREVEIDADPPVAVQIDGDAAGQTPVVATAVRGGARILTPT